MSNKRPYVICHMGSTVDGRIIGGNWGDKREVYGKLYEECHNTFESQAWMVGRITMEKDFTRGKQPNLEKATKRFERTTFIADRDASSFAIAVDANGKLGWESNEIDGDHVIEILSESVTDAYLQYLQKMNISYVFAGKDTLDFNQALEQLHEHFKIEILMLEGGGHINGSLLSSGVVDELSLLILPLADGTTGTPTTFEIQKHSKPSLAREMKLHSVQKLAHDVVWLRYKFN
jgi:riboflavin biosynthesis pyrimidine reductase